MKTPFPRCDMPIIGPKGCLPIPWDIIAPHEIRASFNHGQSLATLRRRGGLSPSEAVAILEDRLWHKMDETEALEQLGEIIREATARLPEEYQVMDRIDTPLDTAFGLSRTPAYFAVHYRDELVRVIGNMDLAAIGRLVAMFDQCRKRDGVIYFCGNGGKAALCAEWVNDLTVALPESKFRAHSLMDNLPGLTAAANDYGYEGALRRIFEPMARPGDVLVCLSGSGNSVNVRHVAKGCESLGVKTVGVCRGGHLKDLVDLHIDIPSRDDGPTEDSTMMVLHIVHAWFLRHDAEVGK